MSADLKIVIAEPSSIVRSGLEAVLKHLQGLRLSVSGITPAATFAEDIRKIRPDVLIVNPSVPGFLAAPQLKDTIGVQSMKCFALLYAPADPELLRHYDDSISIFDTVEQIRKKIESLLSKEEEDADPDEQQSLSAREREIVVCVVKGMTNREIADHLFISTHTVITHRRNIARKLQVHSASALTIYAIVNKLVELKDINK